MKVKLYLIELFIILLSLNNFNCTFINTKQTQADYKKRKKYKKNTKKIIKKRKLDDDEEEGEPTLEVYNRCDNGHTPDDISDCTSNETPESSCCLFSYGQDTGCVLIGFKYLGFKTVGDMTVNCQSKIINLYHILLIGIIIFVII